LLSFFIVCFLVVVQGQPPIPPVYPGHQTGNPDGAIQLEAFFDHLCPDSKAAWTTIQQVLAHYGSQMSLIIHMFPLPYHRNAFYSTQAGLVVQNAKGGAAWFKYLDLVFQNQDQYSTYGTVNMTGTQIIASLGQLAAQLGVSSSTFNQGMQYGSDFDAAARINWKYATTRGIYGTPVFLLNGVWATDNAYLNTTQWEQLIDSAINGDSIQTVRSSILRSIH